MGQTKDFFLALQLLSYDELQVWGQITDITIVTQMPPIIHHEAAEMNWQRWAS